MSFYQFLSSFVVLTYAFLFDAIVLRSLLHDLIIIRNLHGIGLSMSSSMKKSIGVSVIVSFGNIFKSCAHLATASSWFIFFLVLDRLPISKYSHCFLASLALSITNYLPWFSFTIFILIPSILASSFLRVFEDIHNVFRRSLFVTFLVNCQSYLASFFDWSNSSTQCLNLLEVILWIECDYNMKLSPSNLKSTPLTPSKTVLITWGISTVLYSINFEYFITNELSSKSLKMESFST